MRAKQNPRILLTVTPELKASLESYADALGVPTATAIRDLLTQSMPHLERLTKAVLDAKAGNSAEFEKMAASSDRAAQELSEGFQVDIEELTGKS